MTMFEVTYDILVEERTDSFLGSGRSDLQNLKTTVEAPGVIQAKAMVEAMNGGHSRCLVKFAVPK